MNKPKLLTSILLATVCAGSLVFAGTEKLNKAECSLIYGYNNVSKDTFAEHFTRMVHQREYCLEVGQACEVSLQKRTDDFHVLINGARSITDEKVRNVAKREMKNVLIDFYEISDLEPLFKFSSDGDQYKVEKYIYIHFVDFNEATDDFSEYVDKYISSTDDVDHVLRKQVFSDFLDERQPCQTNVETVNDGMISGIHIWVKHNLRKEMMRRCISEEFYNSFGLDEGIEVVSIFDYKYAREDGNYSLSAFDLLKIKILYRDDFKPGMLKINTLKTVENIISNECNIS